MNELEFNQEKHQYSVGKVNMPSVTQIIAATGLVNFGDIDP